MSEKKQDQKPQDAPAQPNEASDVEIAELKRDMRSAQVTAWLEENTQTLIAGVIAVVLALIAGGLWLEHVKSERASAATLYQQALVEKDAAKKQTLMQKVVSDFSGSTYATMAEMQLAALDDAHAEEHLQAVMHASSAMPEWVWQARLDLAELKLEAGDRAAARTLLQESVGRQYEQLRQYLLAMSSDSEAERADHLHKALDAPSLDSELKDRIESLLAAGKRAS